VCARLVRISALATSRQAETGLCQLPGGDSR
jgi:hypothetical protein